jgi:hypothetical protein
MANIVGALVLVMFFPMAVFFSTALFGIDWAFSPSTS